jgi:hypothetical protein
MNKAWLIGILITSLFLLGTLKTHEVATLTPFFKAQRVLKIKKFSLVKEKLSVNDQELVELWESMLTGRSAPLAAWMKERYRLLGLKHLFTPSGFHLSAVLSPFLKLTKSVKIHLLLLALIGLMLFWVPGQGALKRMVLIKGHQKLLGMKTGFVMALLLDILFGSFETGALSFSYSFLFLGIIYSGARGVGLIFWFFIAQLILAYFQNVGISPLLIIFSPILSFCFGLAMPLLFLLAIPLWNWQLELGLMILRSLQAVVDVAAFCLQFIPTWEIHIGVLIMIGLFVYRRWRILIALGFILSNSLNLDQARVPSIGSYEFIPRGEIVRVLVKGEDEVIYFTDGKCQRKLVRGFWWEKCSPRRRSMGRKIKKLSYPSSTLRKSSLRGWRT